MLERQLGRRVELDPLRLAERALGEGGEPADRLDLVAEQLEPGGPVLGRAEDVEDAPADGELAAVLDLVGALVSGLDQELGDVVEVDLLALVEDEPGRPQRGVGDRLGERHRARDDDRRLVAVAGPGERVERPDPQPDQVRRRRQVRLVAGPARRVVADPARGQVGAERAGEVAGADVVGGDHQRRSRGEPLVGVEQRREQIWPDRSRGAQVDRLAGPCPARESGESLVVERDVEQCPEQSAEVSCPRPPAWRVARLPWMSEGKRIGATLLAILAAVALLFAAIAGYATDALFDSDEFAERATVALDDEAVSAEIATRVTDDLVLNAERDLVGARPLIEGVVDGIVGGSVFQSLFRSRNQRRPPLDLQRRREHGHADPRRRRRGAPRRDPGAAPAAREAGAGWRRHRDRRDQPSGVARRRRPPRRRRRGARLGPAGAGADPRRRRAVRLARPPADRDADRGRDRDLRCGRGGRR